MKLLEVENLSIAFQAEGKLVPTVDRVSFDLEQGEILALVGESGCGKSITCMSLAQLLPMPPAKITGGRVLLKKRSGEQIDTLQLSSGELRKIRGGEIAYIFQEPSVSLNPVFRVGEQIMETIALHRPDVTDPYAEAVELLRQVGIPEPADRVKRYPHELSGGMQQRVMIAMALASHPSLLVADEPTTALDVTIQAQILDLLTDLRKRFGTSIILVTHNLGIVAETADRVAVMYAGRIVEQGKVSEVLSHPCHPYTKALLAAVPVLGEEHRRLASIPGSVPSPANFPAGCRFYGRCAEAESRTEEEQKRCAECVPEMKMRRGGHCRACHFAADKEDAE